MEKRTETLRHAEVQRNEPSKNVLKNKRILFIFGHGGMEALVLKLSQELERRWKTTSFFSGGSHGGDTFLVKAGIKTENIRTAEFDDHKRNFPAPDVEYIRKAEEKYGFNSWDIWQITAPRKKSRMKLSGEKVLYWIEYYIRETEKCLEQFKPDYVIFYGIASFSGVIFYKMLLYHNINVLEITNSRIPGRFTINNNPENKWPILQKEYEAIKKRNLTKEEIKNAESFISQFKEKPFKPDGTAGIKIPLSEKAKKYADYVKTLTYRKQIPELKQFIWPLLNRVIDASGTFSLPVDGEKYVYFPLHVTPEVSTSFYGRWYVNQPALIENIARSIPCGYKLYVKEHTFNYSSRSWYFRKEIKKFPNVRLISPHANSSEIIKKSSLVITITGTSGWEAILLQKPAIVFGDIYYSLFEEVSKVHDLRDLPSIIKSKIDKQTDWTKTLKFVSAVFASSFKGVGAAPGDCRKAVDSENISRLADGIEEYVSRMDFN